MSHVATQPQEGTMCLSPYRCLNVNDNYVDVCCVSSAGRVPCTYQSQTKGLSISVCYFIFLNLLTCLLLTYESNNLYLIVKKLHIFPIKEWKAIEMLMVSSCLMVL